MPAVFKKGFKLLFISSQIAALNCQVSVHHANEKVSARGSSSFFHGAIFILFKAFYCIAQNIVNLDMLKVLSFLILFPR